MAYLRAGAMQQQAAAQPAPERPRFDWRALSRQVAPGLLAAGSTGDFSQLGPGIAAGAEMERRRRLEQEELRRREAENAQQAEYRDLQMRLMHRQLEPKPDPDALDENEVAARLETINTLPPEVGGRLKLFVRSDPNTWYSMVDEVTTPAKPPTAEKPPEPIKINEYGRFRMLDPLTGEEMWSTPTREAPREPRAPKVDDAVTVGENRAMGVFDDIYRQELELARAEVREEHERQRGEPMLSSERLPANLEREAVLRARERAVEGMDPSEVTATMRQMARRPPPIKKEGFSFTAKSLLGGDSPAPAPSKVVEVEKRLGRPLTSDERGEVEQALAAGYSIEQILGAL